MATPAPSRQPRTHHVRIDVLAGAGLVATTLLVRLLWLASDAGWFDTFGTR